MIVNILQINKYTVWKNARIICVTADDTAGLQAFNHGQ